MLRLSVWMLAVLCIAGQAIAQVSVTVDMKQTGPTDANGVVQVRVGKNKNADFTATASYTGQPTLRHEEKIQEKKWTYTVSSGNKVTYSPKSGDGNSVTVSAKSVEPGTYDISVTFEVRFTIKTPVKDSNGDYVYVNGTQQFTTREDGPYSGSASATLNVTNGKFKIKLIPNDDFDPQRSYTTFGLGEFGTIKVESDPPGQAVNVTSTKSDNETVCSASIGIFSIKRNPGSATITVKAKIGNSTTEETETYGVTAIAPTSARQVKTNNETLQDNTVGAGYYAKWYLSPTFVSFSQLVLREGEDFAVADGSQSSEDKMRHDPTRDPFKPSGGNITDGCQWGVDNIAARNRPLGVDSGTFSWKSIPLEYADDAGGFKPTGITGYHKTVFNGKGGCTISKFGNSATRIPKNQDAFNQSPSNYSGGFEYKP